jgi:hypothetical protein
LARLPGSSRYQDYAEESPARLLTGNFPHRRCRATLASFITTKDEESPAFLDRASAREELPERGRRRGGEGEDEGQGGGVEGRPVKRFGLFMGFRRCDLGAAG